MSAGPHPAYGEDLAAIHAAGYTGTARAAARELLGRLPPGARVAELGCGDGTTAALLAAAGHEVHGSDASPAMVALARRRAPGATFAVAAFADAPLPAPCDAVVAIGDVLGHAADARAGDAALEASVARAAAALCPGGLLVFDLATPARAALARGRRWAEGEGWAVLVDAAADGRLLTRRIVAFRDAGDGRFRRSEELHRHVLHPPARVLATLRRAGFAARTLPGGYAGEPLLPGFAAYLARRRR